MTQDLSQEQLSPAVAPDDQDRLTATRETLEDYTLRFAPRSYRKWSTRVVGISALGGIAYLADFAIGANIGISYGTTNALAGIAIFAVVIFLTGFPVAYYSARYNIDLDLVTRGSGFGYYGSVVTNVIFATFTFIFFALEGSIMAQGLKLGLGLPLWLGYAVSTLIIFPLVIYGMKVLSTLQVWTTPLWLILMVAPFGYLLISHPESVHDFFAYQGEKGVQGFDLGSTLMAAGVCLSLIAQIDEFKGAWRAIGRIAPERLSSLRRVATIESIGSSTRIEGARLTDREVEVLRLVARGLTTKQVAEALFLSAKTVDHHIQHVYSKIGVSTRAAAALWGVQNGVVG